MSHESGAIRPPARSGALLVPIWGYRFVSQFLEFGLPTLLAPGNLPAVTRELPFRVVALTSEDDKPLLLAHPAWRRLQKICAADTELIDDLITESNHSATMTLALARAIRSYGAEMVDTCFVSWMSDYLSADGSLAAVLRGFQSGASGVVAGNFQIVAEDAIPSLRRSIDLQSSVISVSNRELLAWSLDYLHPATMANCVNAGLSHNSYTDRLFLAGRRTDIDRPLLSDAPDRRASGNHGLRNRLIVRLFVYSGDVPVGPGFGPGRFRRLSRRRDAET